MSPGRKFGTAFSRRRLLAGTVGAALAGPTLKAGGQPELDALPEGLEISIMMWTYRPPGTNLMTQLERVKGLGYASVELVGRLEAQDNEAVAARLRELDLRVRDIDAGTHMYGPASALTHPNERTTVLKNFRRAIANARTFGTDTLLVLSGGQIEGRSREAMRRSLTEGLERLAEIAEAEQLRLIIEPLNRFDHKGYYLTSMYEACEIVREVGSPRLKILFDIYHTQMEEGRLIRQIRDNLDVIGHFHVADCPGRRHPGTGELNYANIYRAIRAAGYRGSIGMEFLANEDHDRELIAMRRMLIDAWRAA